MTSLKPLLNRQSVALNALLLDTFTRALVISFVLVPCQEVAVLCVLVTHLLQYFRPANVVQVCLLCFLFNFHRLGHQIGQRLKVLGQLVLLDELLHFFVRCLLLIEDFLRHLDRFLDLSEFFG